MAIYIDNEFKCHTSDAAGRKEVELSEFAAEFFDGKSNDFIEGYRYIPPGDIWIDENRRAFTGEAISPWKDSRLLGQIQAEYEHELLLNLQAELAALYAKLGESGA